MYGCKFMMKYIYVKLFISLRAYPVYTRFRAELTTPDRHLQVSSVSLLTIDVARYLVKHTWMDGVRVNADTKTWKHQITSGAQPSPYTPSAKQDKSLIKKSPKCTRL